jgi:16S rRNA (guanine527-N7)-methyltransferase
MNLSNISEFFEKHPSLSSDLKSGLSNLSIDLPSKKIQQLLTLLAHLYRWNRVYNLTAIKKPEEGIKRHILDSLTLLDYLTSLKNNASILDVGTGPGFPGLPLAIICPHLHFTLVDSNQKKIRFIHQMVYELALSNVSAQHSRIEALKPASFNVITSRAFSSLSNMIELTHHLLHKKGIWLAMKGNISESEWKAIPPHITSFLHEIPYYNHDESIHRCIVKCSFT